MPHSPRAARRPPARQRPESSASANSARLSRLDRVAPRIADWPRGGARCALFRPSDRKAAADDDRNPPSPAPPRRPPARARRRRSDGGAGGAIRGEALDRRSGAAAARPHPDLDRQCAARRGRLRRDARGRRRRGAHLRRPRRADRAVRRRHLARRPCQRAPRRRVDRLLAHEPRARRPRRGSRLRRRAGRDPQGAQRRICATRACSFPSIPAPTPRSAAWRRRAPPAPTRCATAR